MNFWKWVKKFDHQDFQILELGNPGTSWFWQLVQALHTRTQNNMHVFCAEASACIKGSLGVRDSQKLPWGFQKSMPGSLGLPIFKDI